jgi:hypothetical protein
MLGVEMNWCGLCWRTPVSRAWQEHRVRVQYESKPGVGTVGAGAVANKIQFLAIANPYLSQCKGRTTPALRHFSDSVALEFAVKLQLPAEPAGPARCRRVEELKTRGWLWEAWDSGSMNLQARIAQLNH